MPAFVRPTVLFAIIFGCFAALVPRILLPLIRPRSSSPSTHVHDNFRRTSPISLKQYDDPINDVLSSPSDTFEVTSSTIIPDVITADIQPSDPTGSKSMSTFALPMYAVGILVFFCYTCFRFWTTRSCQEKKIQQRYSSQNIRWNADKNKFKYEVHAPLMDDDDDENGDDQYAGLDADYVEYLKSRRQNDRDVEQTLTTDQTQMHSTLDDMKTSLSFISTTLATNEKKGKLSHQEISQLQDRLASTEAQMYKILSALDAASSKVQEITKSTRQSLEQRQKPPVHEDRARLSSESQSGSEGDLSHSDENSDHPDERVFSDDKRDEEESSSSSSGDDDDDDNALGDENEEDIDDQSETSSGRYGIMDTNYGCDPSMIDDFEIDAPRTPDQTHSTQTKVHEWRERNHSQSLSGSNSSLDQQPSTAVLDPS